MDKILNFDTQASYDAIKDSLEYPTVSYVTENDLAYFKERESYFIARYNVTSTNSSTKLLGFSSSNMQQISKMYIDDIEVTPTSAYTFTTLGKHIVKCEFCKLTSMYSMFMNCTSLTSLDLSSLDTSNATDMSRMFYDCYKLTSLDLSSFDTSKVTNMRYMFGGCSGLTSLDLSSLDTSNVTNMNRMFCDCTKLTSLDLSNFNTSNVTDMRDMFIDCSGLTSLDLSSFDTSNVTNMGYMFHNCSGLTSLDLSSFDTSNVTNMGYMFHNCSSLTSLTILGDVSKVTSYSGMFANITTSGTLIYNCDYEDAWNNILVTNQSTSNFPSTWTKTCIIV